MGSAIFVVLDRDLPELDVFMQGKALAQAEGELTEICQQLDIRDLWSFYREGDVDGSDLFSADGDEGWDSDEDEDSDGYDDEEDEDSESSWFAAADGLETVMTLAEYIDHEDGAGLEDPDGVLEDLRAMERLLELAEAEGAQWRLGADF
ncbi:MAG: hypothetical protein AAGD01_20830 [Acidobacteriota bacterium]